MSQSMSDLGGNRCSRRWTGHGVWLGLGLLVLCAGCGGEPATESTVVTPPGPSGSPTDASDANPDPPGGLELPSGDIPAADPPPVDPAPPAKGGFEMPQDAQIPAADTPAEPEPAGTDSAATIDLQYGTWDEIEQLVKSTGQITVVDLWSLSCEPCLKEFPGLVRLHQTHGSKIQCFAVDLDFDGRKTRPPEHYEDRVSGFLKGVGAEFTTFISRTPSDDVYAAAELDSIPAVLIYGKDGKLVKVFADAGETVGFTYEKDIAPLILKLVNEQA